MISLMLLISLGIFLGTPALGCYLFYSIVIRGRRPVYGGKLWVLGLPLLLFGFVLIFQGGVLLILLCGCLWGVVAWQSGPRSALAALEVARTRLTALLLEYVSGTDRSTSMIGEIETLLTAQFMGEKPYEELLTEVAKFAPGGSGLHDESSLAEVFRAFLEGRKIAIPVLQGVWPPPPAVR